MARLHHPNIVRFYDYGQEEDIAYLVFEFVDGQTLAQVLAPGQPIRPAYAMEIARQAGSALSYAHSQGIIHRDVKPSNILLARDGRILLSDFGLGGAFGKSGMTRIGTTLGTPAYRSPEQAAGQAVDARSDVYSLGLVLYQMLTGQLPFSASTPAEFLYAHLQAPPPPLRKFNPDLNPDLERVVLKALAKTPEDRYPSVDDLLHALLQTEKGSTSTAQPIKAVPAPASAMARPIAAERPVSRRLWRAVAVVAVALFGIAGAIALLAGAEELGLMEDAGQGVLAIGGIALLAALVTLSVRRWRSRPRSRSTKPTVAPRPAKARPSMAVDSAEPAAPSIASPSPAAMETGEMLPYGEVPIPPTTFLQGEGMGAWLLVLHGPQRGQHLPLHGAETAIGRAPGSVDLVVEDPKVSRRHAVIKLSNGRYWLYDKNSTNGSYVNGRRVIQCELCDRDEVRLGGTNLIFYQVDYGRGSGTDVRNRLQEFDEVWSLLDKAVHDD